MKKVLCMSVYLGIALFLVISLTGCPTKIQREGVSYESYFPRQSETEELLNPQNKYSEARETCRQMALANPSGTFIAEGYNNCMFIGDDDGDFRGMWENWTDWTLVVYINPVQFDDYLQQTKLVIPSRQAAQVDSGYAYFYLYPTTYDYTINRIYKGKEVFYEKGKITPDRFTHNAVSRMTGEKLAFVYSTYPAR